MNAQQKRAFKIAVAKTIADELSILKEAPPETLGLPKECVLERVTHNGGEIFVHLTVRENRMMPTNFLITVKETI